MPKPPHIRNVYQRFWVMGQKNEVCYAPIEKPDGLVVFPIPKEMLSKNAVSFINFNSEPGSYHYMLALQSLLFATWKMRELAEKKELKIDQLAQIRLETVYSNKDTNPDVLGYRLWIFAKSSQMTIGDGLEFLLKSNEVIHSRNDGAFSVSEEKTQKKASLPGQKDWKSRLWPHETYRHLNGKDMWAKSVCDFYMGVRRTVAQLDKVNSGFSGLGSKDNPANPYNIFNIADLFCYHTPENAHPDQKDITKYRITDDFGGSVKYGFPELKHLPHHVLKVAFSECIPSMFCYKWLPEYQYKKLDTLREQLSLQFPQLKNSWKQHEESSEDGAFQPSGLRTLDPPMQRMREEILEEDGLMNKPLEDEKPFDNQVLMESHNDMGMEILNNRLYQYYYTSDFRMLKEENSMKLEKLKKITNAKEYRDAYKQYEDDAFENFEGRCWSGDSDISEMGHLIRSWGLSAEGQNTKISHVKYDPSLSVFGNMVARRMEYFDDYLFISSTHKQFFIMNYAKYDAYRDANDLHFNIFGTGVGGTSKSYLFGLVERMSIAGTVEQISYETLRSNAIDRDNNDTIIIMNEIPEEMTTQGVGNSSMQSGFKERLTSLKVKVKLFHQDDSGYRDQRVSVSECIGVWFGATNDDFSKIDEALITRFYQAFFSESQREEKDIVALMYANKAMGDKEKMKSKEFEKEMKLEQYRYFLVEKLIMTKCLPEFNTSTAHIFVRKIMEKLRKDGYHPHSRTVERMIIMIRILSICYGLECLFNIQEGPHFKALHDPKQGFHLNMLKDMKPFLQPSQEIIQFVVGLFNDQLVNPAENDILDAVKRIYETPNRTNRYKLLPFTPEDIPVSLPKPTAATDPSVDPANLRTDNATITLDASVVRTDANLAARSLAGPLSKDKKEDCNYVAFWKSLTQTSEEIYRALEHNTNRPSPNQIKSIITSLKQRTVTSKNYKRAPKAKEPTLDENSQEASNPAVVTDGDGIYFHFSLVMQKERAKDRIQGYLRELWYAQTIEERLVYGVTVENHPHMFQILEAKPAPKNSMIVYNVLHLNECARIMLYNNDPEAMEDTGRRGQELEIINIDLDSRTLMDHFDVIEEPWSQENIEKYHPTYISMKENNWLIQNRGFIKNPDGTIKIKGTFRYYDEYLAQHEEKQKKYNELLKLGADAILQKDYLSTNKKRSRITGEDDNINAFKDLQIGKKLRNSKAGFLFDESLLENPNAMVIDSPPIVQPVANSQAPVLIQSVDPSNLPRAPPQVVLPVPVSVPAPLPEPLIPAPQPVIVQTASLPVEPAPSQISPPPSESLWATRSAQQIIKNEGPTHSFVQKTLQTTSGEAFPVSMFEDD